MSGCPPTTNNVLTEQNENYRREIMDLKYEINNNKNTVKNNNSKEYDQLNNNYDKNYEENMPMHEDENIESDLEDMKDELYEENSSVDSNNDIECDDTSSVDSNTSNYSTTKNVDNDKKQRKDYIKINNNDENLKCKKYVRAKYIMTLQTLLRAASLLLNKANKSTNKTRMVLRPRKPNKESFTENDTSTNSAGSGSEENTVSDIQENNNDIQNNDTQTNNDIPIKDTTYTSENTDEITTDTNNDEDDTIDDPNENCFTYH
ncbi:unnamed protein product [Mucor hiemalis]